MSCLQLSSNGAITCHCFTGFSIDVIEEFDLLCRVAERPNDRTALQLAVSLKIISNKYSMQAIQHEYLKAFSVIMAIYDLDPHILYNNIIFNFKSCRTIHTRLRCKVSRSMENLKLKLIHVLITYISGCIIDAAL